MRIHRNMKKHFVTLLATLIAAVTANGINPCIANSDCGTCLRADGRCMFCKDPKLPTGINNRCDYLTNLEKAGCRNIMKTQGTIKSKEDRSFSNIVQIRPQKIVLNMRPTQTMKFTLKIRPAKNFPVHLYYLMDMSKSMQDDLNNLKNLGRKIGDEISKVTTNYKLAFGTFVDKTVVPFIQLENLNKLCTVNDGTQCVKTFGYKHIFDFNSNQTLFEDAVKKQKISSNADIAEGGFDALMQVAVCNTTLKWQPVEVARRIVVFVTDAIPHIAGDGRIGGIVEPNDGMCHLSNGEYTQSNFLDYPSVSFLKEKLKENSIIPIIAVTRNQRSFYNNIVKEWSKLNTVIGTLESDSSNVAELIREEYTKIVRTLRPSADVPDGVTLRFKSTNCEKALNEGAICADALEGKDYSFTVYVNIRKCPKNTKDWTKPIKFTINVPGFGKSVVELNMICECDCEKIDNPNSTECNGTGNYKCGICYCPKGQFGDLCECNENSHTNFTLCMNNNMDIICSGKGTCICGNCNCFKRPGSEVISGKHCECDNFSCGRFNNFICGGEERGTCECGICKCKEGFMGETCGEVRCQTGKCELNGEVCSNNGKCDCDKCVCNEGYVGQYCEDCISCPSKCSKYKECVRCVVWNEGDLAHQNCATCKTLHINMIDNKETDMNCQYLDENKCWIQFSFINVKGKDIILVREKYCESIGRPLVDQSVVFGIIGGLVGLVLSILLLWKLLITAYDNYRSMRKNKNKQTNVQANVEGTSYRKEGNSNETHLGDYMDLQAVRKNQEYQELSTIRRYSQKTK